MNPLLIPLIIAIVVALAFLIAWLIAITETNKARRDVTTLNRALGQERTNTASWRAEAGTWRKKFEALNKPRPSIGRPQESKPGTVSIKEAGRLVPRTPMQQKLSDMTEAIIRKSPVRHAPNIQPRRDETMTSGVLEAAIIATVLDQATVTNHTDLTITGNNPVPDTWTGNFGSPDPSPSHTHTPDPAPSYDPSPSYDSGSSISSSDSGSFGGGDSGSF